MSYVSLFSRWWDLTQNEVANAEIYEELVQSELANIALYRDLVQIESDNVGVTCFCNDPFPNDPISEWLTLMISSKSTGECTGDDWSMIGNTAMELRITYIERI